MNLVIAICLFIIPINSWGIQGHRVVAYIAQKLVEEDVLKNMRKLFQKDTDLVYYSTRPDDYDHCDGGKWSAPLHYVDVENEVFIPGRDCKNSFCVFGAILNYTKRLNPNNPQCYAPFSCHKEKENPEPCPLEFLTHFVADIHQPLHVADSELFPNGGSRTNVYVDFIKNIEIMENFTKNDSGEWDEEIFIPMKINGTMTVKTTIHKVWDTVIIGEYLTRTYSKPYYYKSWGDDLIYLLMKDEQKLFKELSKEEDPYVWSQKTLDSCVEHAANYDRETNHLTEEYYQEGIVVVNLQILKAAARLTKRLNCLLK